MQEEKKNNTLRSLSKIAQTFLSKETLFGNARLMFFRGTENNKVGAFSPVGTLLWNTKALNLFLSLNTVSKSSSIIRSFPEAVFPVSPLTVLKDDYTTTPDCSLRVRRFIRVHDIGANFGSLIYLLLEDSISLADLPCCIRARFTRDTICGWETSWTVASNLEKWLKSVLVSNVLLVIVIIS